MSRSVLDALKNWAEIQPDRTVWSFLDDKGVINDSFTYAQLERATTSLAVYLRVTCKLSPGDRVLLVFFPGLGFTASLLACFKAGLIAVPTFPPDPRRLKKDLHHFISIQSSSGAKVVLTHAQYNFAKKVAELKNLFSGSGWPNLTWIQVDDVLSKGKNQLKADASSLTPINENDIAFLQYTSGSTSEPKGVMITHRNLSHNLKIIIKELKADRSTINVSWLPQYHDMGLIGSYMGLLYCGGQGYYISPISFLKDPVLWVRAMSNFRASHTQAPNFAYALVVRKYKEFINQNPAAPSTLDLSCLKHMIDAAEPVDASVIIDFHSTFSPYGLAVDVLKPTYGLAEHTVFVCSGGDQILTVPKESIERGFVEVLSEASIKSLARSKQHLKRAESSSKTQEIAGCGYPFEGEDVDVAIVDPESCQAVPANRIGEIWVKSPSKAKGYWGLAELTKEDFEANILSNDDNKTIIKEGYLRTGDLGFMYKNELFICGRIKDLIIIRGSNHYPQDIERTAEKVAGLRAGCSAAFAIKRDQDDTEAVIYVAEVKETTSSSEFASIADSCRLSVASEHGVALSTVLLLKPRTVPKTTSGKIARSWCRREFLKDTLSIVYRWNASSSDLLLPEDLPDEPSIETLQQPKNTNTSVKEEEMHMVAPNKLSVSEVRLMKKSEVVRRLESTLVLVASTGPSPLTSPLDPSAPLTALGMDSLTIVQFKGALENQYYCSDVPDEFMFTNLCTLNGLGDVVLNGTLTSEQRKLLDSAAKPDADGNSGVVVVEHKELLCPWFVWCC